ncbi:sensor domain-containing diguanylate cyclase [Thiomicrorhabdus sp. ZW0627]|uniref:sensor domain-containing diguanylate cyclase n=1 Tax=Thiomicrorhabdus sp. ZW0627 TaxID=3039774 RepID=UPI0024373527|nr:sensor domain-containing diguanylate cyclase [Thiomicrorhabdus sp. ZW0627]MDG6774739.1 sensor domain-containing diguanylate cyclase [Thiomicrorhabdus sp. ZW0627]
MLTISSINQMIGVDDEDRTQFELSRAFFIELKPLFLAELNGWLNEYDYQIEQVFIDGYYDALVSGHYSQEFYIRQYTQCTYWYKLGLSSVRTTLIINQCRHMFFKHTSKSGKPQLGYVISQALDIAQAVSANVYAIAGMMEKMHQKFRADITGIERATKFGSIKISEELVGAYIDHVNWKVRLFSMALGSVEDEEFPYSTDECSLGKWLNAGGWDKIPADQKESFDLAHRQVHSLARQAIQDSIAQHPENIIKSLSKMEKASDKVAEVLLQLIDEQIIHSATLDGLTELPLRKVFDEEYGQMLSLARRQHLRVGLIILDVDHFKKVNDEKGHLVGDQVLKKLAEVLKNSLRQEDKVYRWGGEEFAVMTLGEGDNNVSALAERIRSTVEQTIFCENTDDEMRVTVSCGTVCFNPLKTNSIDKMFSLADKQLYFAKQNGRNRVESQTLDME